MLLTNYNHPHSLGLRMKDMLTHVADKDMLTHVADKDMLVDVADKL